MPTAERSRRRRARTGTVDWDRVLATTEDNIAQQIAEDADTAPEMTEEALARAFIVRRNGKRMPYRDRAEGQSDLCLPPGTRAPRSGRYELVDPSGGRIGEERTVRKGEPLPPTPASGQRYRPVPSGRRRPKA